VQRVGAGETNPRNILAFPGNKFSRNEFSSADHLEFTAEATVKSLTETISSFPALSQDAIGRSDLLFGLTSW
jgi:hypothetical protein